MSSQDVKFMPIHVKFMLQHSMFEHQVVRDPSGRLCALQVASNGAQH